MEPTRIRRARAAHHPRGRSVGARRRTGKSG